MRQHREDRLDLDPLLLSRIQFAFVITFHIIFPAFTIGLAAWLATIEGMRLATGDPVYRRVFDFWLKVFALSFGMGVVTGIVMAFQFGTNWSVLSERTGSIQGPLLGYEAFTAFHARGDVFRRDAAGPRAGAALVLFPVVLHGLSRHDGVVVLDPVQQQLDAGAARPRRGRRQVRAGRLVGDHHRAGRAGALAAYAVRRFLDHRHERCRNRRLVPATRAHIPRKGASCCAGGWGWSQ